MTKRSIKLKTINDVLRLFGFVLVVETPVQGGEEPVRFYFKSTKNAG